METVVQPPAHDEIHLLTHWGDASDRPRHRRAAIGSVIFHAVAITALLMVPRSFLTLPHGLAPFLTPLVAPPELTQKEPNNGKLNKQLDVVGSRPRPAFHMPPGGPAVPPEIPRASAAPPPKPLPEPPRIEAGIPKPDLPLPLTQPQAPPRIQESEQKMAFETPRALPAPEPGAGRPLPRAADVIRGGLGGGAPVPESVPPSPGMHPNAMQLLSDPMGADFKPYLREVQAAVSRYWQMIYPGLGRSGKVTVLFSVDRSGQVPKLVIASASGTAAVDRAAVSAISGSVPFPPFPKEYRGDSIRLQIDFSITAR